MSFRHSLLLFMAVILLWVSNAAAATINSATCSQTDVQAAIDKSITGDMVSVPAGACTWTGTVLIPTTKKITLQGAGMGSTIITKTPVNTFVLGTNQSGSRVTGFQFVDGPIKVDGDGWRIDHCKFVNSSVLVQGNREAIHPTGLVDNCDLRNSFVGIGGWMGLMANALWAQPLDLGSGNNVVYIENNTFTFTVFGRAVDANYGGRYVFRYNTLNDCYIEAHSVQGQNRAVRKWEIYNNRINQISRAMWVPMMLRGGTGVVFNNTVTGTWSAPGIALDNVRSTAPLTGREDITTTIGWCTGSSTWDGNTPGMSGYSCRDQIGQSTDKSLWTSTNPYPAQQHDPAYAWNNKLGTTDVSFFIHAWSDLQKVHIVQGRDFFNNTPRPGYVPYTYPHPLSLAWGTDATIPTPPPTTTTTTTTPPATTTIVKTTKTTTFKNGRKIVTTIFNR